MSDFVPTTAPTNPRQLNRHPGSYVDPSGTLFEASGELLRGINDDAVDYYVKVLNDPVVRDMIGKEIVETTVYSQPLAGYSLTLQHRPLSPVSFCYEWPVEMLQDAALLTLDICLRLVDQDWTLQDGSPWNVVYEATKPIFVDFTSIVVEDRNLLWVAYDQFCRHFLYPLVLYRFLPGRAVRAYLLDSLSGVSADDMAQLLPASAALRMPLLIGRLYGPRFVLAMARRLQREQQLLEMGSKMQPEREARRSFFQSLRRDVTRTQARTKSSRWANYYADIESFFEPARFDEKQATVARLLAELRPTSVVDIGCNRGGYSVLAAKEGVRTVAFDTDEASVSLLYRLARQKNLSILPLVMDVLNPSPACGWRAQQFPSAPQRFRSEMAMALALVHHLAITQRQSFERIVPALADYAEKWLLTEFVPLEDPRSQELLATNRRAMDWYTLENYLAALGEMFCRIETYPSSPQGRVLILCTR